MSFLRAHRSCFSLTAVIGSLLMLGACSMFATETPVKKPVSSVAGSQGYLLNLSLAHLSFDRQPDDVAAAMPYVTKMNGYASTKNPRPVAVTVVEFKFKTNDDSKNRKLIVPVTAPNGRATDLGNLHQVIRKLAAYKPEYRSVHARIVTLATREAVSKARTPDIGSKVNDLYQTVYESAQTPPRIDAARLQIALTRFFMQEKVRDAAYVSLENAKELLAGVDTSRQEDADEVQALSLELENLENMLHKNLPYTF